MFEQLLFGNAMLWAFVYTAAFCYRQNSDVKTLVKLLAVVPFAILAWMKADTGWLAVAFALCAVGDFCLSRDGRRWFLCGVGAFALGHLAFVPAFIHYGATVAGAFETGRLIGAALVLLLLITTVPKILTASGDLRTPVTFYILCILTMFLAAMGLPGTVPVAMAALGAVLFVISDCLLGQQMFAQAGTLMKTAMISIIIWVAYWLALMCFALAFIF